MFHNGQVDITGHPSKSNMISIVNKNDEDSIMKTCPNLSLKS